MAKFLTLRPTARAFCLSLVCSAAAAVVFPSGLLAEDFPTKPVKVIVPYAAGGPADVLMRTFGQKMAVDLGQPVIVENVTGAGGTIGASRAAAATPDGYTLVMAASSTHSSVLAFYDDLKYDPVKSFASVGLLSTNPIVVIARKNLPPKDLREFIAYLKENGQKVNNGHGGTGSVSYSACVIFNSLVGADSTMVAYRGVGPATMDMLAGVVDYTCDHVPSASPHISRKAVKAYVVSSTVRQAAIPDVPTGQEAGLPQFKFDVWYGISAPKGTPPAVLARLNRAMQFAQDDESVRARISQLGGEIPPSERRSGATLDEVIQTDLKMWVPLLIAAKGKIAAKDKQK